MSMFDIDTLNQQFGIAEQLSFELKAKDFPIVNISNASAHASIALQGGHLMTYQPQGQAPVIWLSQDAKYVVGKSIRGGVPICWPWFGPHAEDASQPGHGHARTVMWDVLDTTALDAATTQIRLQLQMTENTHRHWSHNTPVQVCITVGANLQVELVTRNDTEQSLTISEALHTYFNISDISDVRILGLEDTSFLDKVEGMQRKTQQGVVNIASEVDRVYLNTAADCVIEDPGFKRCIRIQKTDSQSTIVWNPWIENAKKMGDLGEQGYRRMLCVESGNALENSVEIAPGESHRLAVVYSVETL